MAPSAARFNFVHHSNQSPLRRPILLSTFEEVFYQHGTVVGRFFFAILKTLDSFILTLPASSLERISVDVCHHTMPWEHYKDSFSSIVLRCRPSLTEYNSPVPLPNATLDHLIQLPHLRTWRIHGPPPTYTASSLPPVFPPFKEFTLGKMLRVDGFHC